MPISNRLQVVALDACSGVSLLACVCHESSAHAQQGDVLLLRPSGVMAGKTTLMDVLACRKNSEALLPPPLHLHTASDICFMYAAY